MQDVLLRSDPSGLFEARCRAARALKALGGGNVLASFLSAPRLAADPMQRLGDEAVVEAAARALAEARRDDANFRLLLRLGHEFSYLAGVVEALGSFDRPEAARVLVLALGEDTARPSAEAALLRLGRAALRFLVPVAASPYPSAEVESDASRRKRRSALALVWQIGCTKRTWRRLRSLVHDKDARIAALACKLCLLHGSAAERAKAAGRLAELLADADWMLRAEIQGGWAGRTDLSDIHADPKGRTAIAHPPIDKFGRSPT
ncbi:hypothetical protein [Ollibium composti]|uniref:HEAT repeat domain-containing protein n=1 Tax=Ollibium composti TaxID=2675109 RepID=A0ABY2Q9A0_9HYPH|nr:hypothetical protein [Mesorhizobium composti]THF58171.1 hypothetical protein E6C48_06010 [Mesorhizobium composti]